MYVTLKKKWQNKKERRWTKIIFRIQRNCTDYHVGEEIEHIHFQKKDNFYA